MNRRGFVTSALMGLPFVGRLFGSKAAPVGPGAKKALAHSAQVARRARGRYAALMEVEMPGVCEVPVNQHRFVLRQFAGFLAEYDKAIADCLENPEDPRARSLTFYLEVVPPGKRFRGVPYATDTGYTRYAYVKSCWDGIKRLEPSDV